MIAAQFGAHSSHTHQPRRPHTAHLGGKTISTANRANCVTGRNRSVEAMLCELNDWEVRDDRIAGDIRLESLDGSGHLK